MKKLSKLIEEGEEGEEGGIGVRTRKKTKEKMEWWGGRWTGRSRLGDECSEEGVMLCGGLLVMRRDYHLNEVEHQLEGTYTGVLDGGLVVADDEVNYTLYNRKI